MPFQDRSVKTGPLLTPPTDGQVTESDAFLIYQSQSGTSITDLNFSSTSVGGFTAQVYVFINATPKYSEIFTLNGCYNGSDWLMSITSATTEETGISFAISAAGQVTYSSSTWSGFSSGYLKFKVETIGVI